MKQVRDQESTLQERTPTTEAAPQATDSRTAATHSAAGGGAWRRAARTADFAAGEAMLAPVQQKQDTTRGATGAEADGTPGAESPAGVSIKSFGHWVQSGLNQVDRDHPILDAPLQIDGILGKRTRAGVTAFQRHVKDVSASEPKLAVDGAAGPDTIGALERAVGVKNPAGKKATPLPEAKQAEAGAETTPTATTPDAAPPSAAEVNGGGATAASVAPTAAPAEREEKAEPGAAAPEADLAGGDAGAALETVLPPTPAQEAQIAAEAAPDKGAGSAPAAAGEASQAGSDADLAARLEKARAELGKVKEKAYKGVPPLMPKRWAKKLEATLKRKHPGQEIKSTTVWYAADAASLERLEAYATSVGMGSYSGFIASHGAGYAWCGSFVGAHYQLNANMTSKRKGKKSTVRANAALASTTKSYAFFNYKSQWAGAWIRDPEAAADAPVTARYKPLTAYHDAHGGRRQWLPVEGWRDQAPTVAVPGMVLFVKGKTPQGDHITFVDRVAPDGAGGWIVHTVEGNGPKVATAANSYPLPKTGKTEIKAVARAAALDFDATVEMLDAATFKDLVKSERS